MIKVKKVSANVRRNQERHAAYFREALARFVSSLPKGINAAYTVQENDDGSVDVNLNGIWRG